MSKRHALLCSCCLLVSFVFSLFCGSTVNAVETETKIQKRIVDKMIYQGVYGCYTGDYVKSQLELKEYQRTIGFLLNENAYKKKDSVALITGMGSDGWWSAFKGNNLRYDIGDSGLNCSELFMGGNYLFGGENVSLLDATGHSLPERTEVKDVKDFMTGMGYEVKGKSSSNCYFASYVLMNEDGEYVFDGDPLKTNSICKEGDSLTTDGLDLQAVWDDPTGYIRTYPVVFDVDDNNKLCVKAGVDDITDHYDNLGCYSVSDFSVDGINEVMEEVCSKYGGQGECNFEKVRGYGTYPASFKWDTREDNVKGRESLSGYKASFSDSSVAGLQAVKYLSGDSEYDEEKIKYSPAEKRILYQAYLISYFGVDVNCEDGQRDNYFDGKFAWFDSASGSMKECHYKKPAAEEVPDEPVNGIDDNGFLSLGLKLGLDDLIDAIENMPESYSEEELGELVDVSSDPLEGEEEKETVCYANSGSLGWIICPIIEGVSRVGTAMWEFIENEFLQIRAGDLFQSNGGLEQVWQQFRDIANILFIILFLVVIFSQLTGVGIDNYGIKKILPRLVVVAILVNLSFLICALAVDISNILGSGLNALFTSMAGKMPENIKTLAPVEASGGSIVAVVGIGLGGVALFGLLNPVGTALTVGGVFLGVGLAVLGIVISIVFSILFMFMILIIRDAGIVMLIAVSPVAIICYMLPNTEKLFKKWFEMLKALLVVYPICGAMIGAGRLAGNMLASIPDSSGMAIAGMVVNVLPFFLVPTLLKRSLSLMGNVGARLSSVGKNVGRKTGAFANGKITSTQKFKDWSQYSQDAALARRARRIQRRLQRVRDRGEPLSDRNNEKLLKATETINAHNERRAHGAVGELLIDRGTMEQKMKAQKSNMLEKMYSDNYAKMERRDVESAFASSLSGDSGENTVAAMNALLAKGGTAEVLRVLDSANWSSVNGDVKRYLAQAMGATNVDALKSFSKYVTTGGGASFHDWATGSISAAQRAEDVRQGAKDGTYAQHLLDGGENAMANYSKDEMQFVQSNANALRSSMEGISGSADEGKKMFGSMLKNTAIKSNDAKVQTIAENTMSDQLANDSIDLRHLNATSDDLSNMRGETALAIQRGVESSQAKATPTATPKQVQAAALYRIRNSFKDQVAGVNADIRAKNRVKRGTGEVFNIK